jgi:hypothetical protein
MLAAGSDATMRATFDDWLPPAQASPRPATIVVDEGPLPGSFRALVQKADVILRARVTSVGAPAELLAGAKTPLAVHLDPLAILETLKAPAAPLPSQDELQLMQFGGTITASGRPVETINDVAVTLRKDQEVVVFLRKHPARDAFVLVSSLVGVFEVTNEGRSVSVPRDAREMPELFGKTSMTLADLRAAIGKGKSRRE